MKRLHRILTQFAWAINSCWEFRRKKIIISVFYDDTLEIFLEDETTNEIQSALKMEAGFVNTEPDDLQ